MIDASYINDLSDLIYIVDPISYELLFLNPAGYDLLGISDISTKKCYEAVYHLNSPCKFCPKSFLNTETFYTWEIENTHLGKHFILKDKLIKWHNDQLVHLCTAIDITTLEVSKKHMDLVTQSLISICLKTLHTTYDLDQTIHFILERLCKLLHSDQAYLCQFNETATGFKHTYSYHSPHCTCCTTLSNNTRCTTKSNSLTKDWQKPHIKVFTHTHTCADDIAVQVTPSPFSVLDALAIQRWAGLLLTTSFLWLEDSKVLMTKSLFEYPIFKKLHIHQLLTVSFCIGNHTMGFISLANSVMPTDSIIYLLKTIGYFALQTMDRLETRHLLEKLSYYDALTDVYNRNKYILDLTNLSKKQLSSIGIVYIDINGLKTINDKYGHTYGDELIIQVTTHIKTVFKAFQIYRVGGDEFIILCPNITEEDFQTHLALLKSLMLDNKTYHAAIGPLWTDCNIDIENLIRQADQLMYEDKKNYYRNNIMPHRKFFPIN